MGPVVVAAAVGAGAWLLLKGAKMTPPATTPGGVVSDTPGDERAPADAITLVGAGAPPPVAEPAGVIPPTQIDSTGAGSAGTAPPSAVVDPGSVSPRIPSRPVSGGPSLQSLDTALRQVSPTSTMLY